MAQILPPNQNPHVLLRHHPVPLTAGSRSECNVQGCAMDLRHRNISQDHPADIALIGNHMQWHVDQQRLRYNQPAQPGVPAAAVWLCQSADNGDPWCNSRALHGLTNEGRLNHYLEHQEQRNESSGVSAIFRIAARDRRKLGPKKPIPSVFVGYLEYERHLPQRDRHIVRASINAQGALSFKIHVSDDNSPREGRLGAVDPHLPGLPGQPAPVPPANLKVADSGRGEIYFLDAFLELVNGVMQYQGDVKTCADVMRLCRKGNPSNCCDEDGGLGLMSELIPSMTRRRELIDEMIRDPNSNGTNMLRGHRYSNLLAQSLAVLNPFLRQFRPNRIAFIEWQALDKVHSVEQLD